MKRTQVIALTLLLLGATVRADADIIDFVGMANGTTGESAWNTLTVDLFGSTAKVDITGYDGGPRYAYLDRGWGGLGVCEVLTAGAAANTKTNSGNNLCNPSNDDNVTNAPEFLSFIFDTDVVVDGIWVNNNHDGDGSMRNNSILINNASYSFVNDGGAGINSFNGNPYIVSAGQAFTIGYGGANAEAFYVSQMSVRAVPEPLTLLLLGTGLLGVGARNRRRQRKH